MILLFVVFQAQQDIAAEKKREEVEDGVEDEGEDPYNEENIEQVGSGYILF